MNRWKHIHFFDKNGKYYNFDYDSDLDMWTGDIYLPQVSVGLFEVGQLFILQEFINSNTNKKEFGFPHSLTASTTGNSGTCNWEVNWETSEPDDIFLFQFDLNYNTQTQTSLQIENAGPKMEKYEEILVPLEYDSNQSIDNEGYIITDDISSEVLQINFGIVSDEENTFKRTLVITDECTNSTVAKFTVYGETIGEDERLRVLTNNLGYNISLEDSCVFRDTNIYESLPNFIELNRKRKEIMLEGHNIYPFIGAYKGLINAINYFGYSNLQVREFWKNIDANSPRFGKYIQSNPIKISDPNVNYNDLSITLPNKNYRKTNLFSLIYKINEIDPGEFTDEDLPETREVFDYTIEEILIKLFCLKNKLEKEFLPFNARIKDITGEADYFGLLEVTNTISRNDKRNINVGIKTDFTVSPDKCIYIDDLRSFQTYCENNTDDAESIVNFCSAYVDTLSIPTGTTRNLLLGPYTSGDELPKSPKGPDPNSVLGALIGGQNITISQVAGVYAGYFSNYAPNLKKFGTPIDGKTSLYYPDKPGIPVGALTVLENSSFGLLTWDNIELTWSQLTNANSYVTYDLYPNDGVPGDVFVVTDTVTNTGIEYTVHVGDNDLSIRNEIYDAIINLKNSTAYQVPWIFWDISKVQLTSGEYVVRIFGSMTENIKLTVDKIEASDATFDKIDYPGDLLYTWDSITRGNFSEIEWTIYKDENEFSPEYAYNIRGPIGQYEKLPITLPYVGDYNVEMRLYDMYNNISSVVKEEVICVDNREVEFSGWYQARKESYTWVDDGEYNWNNYGSSWNLPMPPTLTWDEETPSLYDSLDRVNAILNTFGLGVHPDFQLLNYQDDGSVSFSGPYFWNNLDEGNWNDTYHLWWDMTAVTGDSPAFFQFYEVIPNSYLKIIDINGNEGLHYFDSSTTTLSSAASQLNLSSDPVISKYEYNVVYDAANNQKFLQGVSRYFGLHGDWSFIDIVDKDGNRVCRDSSGDVTGVTGCLSLIYRKSLHTSSNPTWDTAKFINDGKTLPKMTWVMFVYDKCKIASKAKPKWTIKNTSNPNSPDIYFESKYLTYLFKEEGKFSITLELTDSNGNKYKKERNILIIK